VSDNQKRNLPINNFTYLYYACYGKLSAIEAIFLIMCVVFICHVIIDALEKSAYYFVGNFARESYGVLYNMASDALCS
jgi:hypothetical protein